MTGEETAAELRVRLGAIASELRKQVDNVHPARRSMAVVEMATPVALGIADAIDGMLARLDAAEADAETWKRIGRMYWRAASHDKKCPNDGHRFDPDVCTCGLAYVFAKHYAALQDQP